MTELQILLPAFVAGLLMLSASIPLGEGVLRRGSVLVDLALAQVASMGAVAAQSMHASFMAMQASALASALLCAALFIWMEKKHADIAKGLSERKEAEPKKGTELAMWNADLAKAPPMVVKMATQVSLVKWNEVLVGGIFVLSSAISLILLSLNPFGAEHINNILSGQLLLVSWPLVLWFGAASAALGLSYRLWPNALGGRMFYIWLAVFVTMAAQAAGIYLVFAMLVFPTVGTYFVRRRRRMWQYLGAAAGLSAGLLGSFYFDVATGPAVVLGIAASMGGVMIWSIRSG